MRRVSRSCSRTDRPCGGDFPLEIRGLRSRLGRDKLVLPGGVSWDDARRAWNLAVDQRPAAVALPETADDVIALVRFARSHGLRVTPQGTGHGAPRSARSSARSCFAWSA